MARYSRFKYGDGTKYGTSPSTNNLLWGFIVDWNNDGYYTGDNEARYMLSLSVSRGRDHYLKAIGRGFERYKIGTFTAILDNSNGRYTPWNAAGPLYPNIGPGPFCRLFVKDGNTGTQYDVMRGIISDIRLGRRGNRDVVTVFVEDGLGWLSDSIVNVGLHQDFGIDQLFPDILTDAGWPFDRWAANYDTGFATELPYWWGTRRNALDLIQELEEIEQGYFFHSSDGKATSIGRDTVPAISKTVTENMILRDLILPQPWDNIRNSVNITVYPRTEVSGQTLFTIQDTPVSISDGETLQFWAELTYDGRRIGGEAIGYSLTANTNDDGSGVDISSDMTVELNVASQGDAVDVEITNGSGSDGYIISFSLNGIAIDNPDTSISLKEDTTSIANYHARSFIMNNKWVPGMNRADNIAEFVLGHLKNPVATPTIKIQGRTSLQFHADLAQVWQLQLSTYGIDTTYRIAKIQHQWLSENGQSVITTLGFEPYYDPSGYWIFTTQIGTTSIFGY